MIAILERHGFVSVRQSGSHLVFRHPDGRRTTVTFHAGRDLGRGLLRQIMRDAELTPDDIK
jgi:predicted RNA binding protein YcfA (HicA-like mRNA interferase family)